MEVDKNASAGRIARQIRQIELEIETLEHNEKIKEELLIYKEAVSHYPDLKIEIENKLKKQKEYEI